LSETINASDAAIERVLHPTDFSEASLTAFYHALKAALLTKSKLTLLNVSDDGGPAWADFPGIRETLERWRLLPPNSPRAAVRQLGVRAEKIVAKMRDPVKAVVGFLEKEPVDLIVLATSNREGRALWLGSSVSEPIARTAWQTTLFIPANSKGFVSPADGSVHLKRVLIPIAKSPRAQPAVEAAVRLVNRLNCPSGVFTLMHAGGADSMPAVRCPEVDGWTWEKQLASGDVIQSIIKAAKDLEADLIVMSTDGRNEFLDALRGSHSERVLRHGVAPLLTVPVGELAATDPHIEADDD
jgi:nucleotide-binding universal stress UspA family protein